MYMLLLYKIHRNGPRSTQPLIFSFDCFTADLFELSRNFSCPFEKKKTHLINERRTKDINRHCHRMSSPVACHHARVNLLFHIFVSMCPFSSSLCVVRR